VGDPDNIRAALERLEGDLHEKWLDTAGTVFMEEWAGFAGELEDVAEEYELPGLREYARGIHEHVRDFNIEKLKKLGSLYPSLVMQYRRRVNL
jgi:hypothetical protein